VAIDLITRLPIEIGFDENPRASDTSWQKELLALVKPKTLLLLDRGFYHFQFWHQLREQGVNLITRLKKRAAIQVEEVFTNSYGLADPRGRLGSGTKKTSFIPIS